MNLGWNHFACSATAFNREEFFTASLMSLMSGVPQAEVAFLSWLQKASGEELVGRRWTKQAEFDVEVPSLGWGRIDLVLRSGALELWCEHKLGAKPGTTKGADGELVHQLVKYQRAREKYEAENPGTRVLLFFITSDVQTLNQEEMGRSMPLVEVGSCGSSHMVGCDGKHCSPRCDTHSRCVKYK